MEDAEAGVVVDTQIVDRRSGTKGKAGREAVGRQGNLPKDVRANEDEGRTSVGMERSEDEAGTAVGKGGRKRG